MEWRFGKFSLNRSRTMTRLHARHPNDRGFTIVELLIVIVVIAILAAVSIVAYTGVQQKTRTSAVSFALSQATKKLATYMVDNDSYPSDLASLNINDTSSVDYQYSVNNSSNPATYCITATSGNVSYKASSASAAPSSGGCAGHGVGGVAAITNLLYNPSSENNATSNNWAYYSSPLTIDATKAAVGTRSLQTITNSATNPQGLVFAGQGVPAGTYTCSVYLASSPNASMYVSGRTETPYAEALGTQTIALTSSFQRVTVTFTLAASVGTIEIQSRLTAATSGVTIWGDGAMCVSGSSMPTYADGSSPNWIWKGTANGSASTGPAL